MGGDNVRMPIRVIVSLVCFVFDALTISVVTCNGQHQFAWMEGVCQSRVELIWLVSLPLLFGLTYAAVAKRGTPFSHGSGLLFGMLVKVGTVCTILVHDLPSYANRMQDEESVQGLRGSPTVSNGGGGRNAGERTRCGHPTTHQAHLRRPRAASSGWSSPRLEWIGGLVPIATAENEIRDRYRPVRHAPRGTSHSVLRVKATDLPAQCPERLRERRQSAKHSPASAESRDSRNIAKGGIEVGSTGGIATPSRATGENPHPPLQNIPHRGACDQPRAMLQDRRPLPDRPTSESRHECGVFN